MAFPYSRNKFCQLRTSNGGLTALVVTLLFMNLILLDAQGEDSPSGLKTADFARMPRRNTLVANVTFVVFDTETTGFSPTKDRIVEIGAVKFRNGQVLEEKSWLVNPGRPIPPWVIDVHGITDEMVKDAPSFKEVYPEFEEFTRGAVLMAHNARFDIAFMAAEMRRAGFVLPNNLVIDSLALFRKWFPASPSHALVDVARYTEIQTDTLHRGLADSMYVFLIFSKALVQRNGRMKLGWLYAEGGGPLAF